MDCKRVIDVLADFLDGVMPPEDRDALQEHFEDCPPCLRFLESYQNTTSLCRLTLMKETPKEVTERLREFLRSRCKG